MLYKKKLIIIGALSSFALFSVLTYGYLRWTKYKQTKRIILSKINEKELDFFLENAKVHNFDINRYLKYMEPYIQQNPPKNLMPAKIIDTVCQIKKGYFTVDCLHIMYDMILMNTYPDIIMITHEFRIKRRNTLNNITAYIKLCYDHKWQTQNCLKNHMLIYLKKYNIDQDLFSESINYHILNNNDDIKELVIKWLDRFNSLRIPFKNVTIDDYEVCLNIMTNSIQNDLRILPNYKNEFLDLTDMSIVANYRAWDMVYMSTELEEEDFNGLNLDNNTSEKLQEEILIYEKTVKEFEEYVCNKM